MTVSMTTTLPGPKATKPKATEPRRPPRGAVIAIAGSVLALFSLFAFGLVLIPRFQAAHPPTPLQRSDANLVALDDHYLDLTLVTPGFLESRKLGRHFEGRDPASVLPVLVGLNTHTGSIEHMHHLPNNLSLVGPDGARYPSIGAPIVLSQHHNAYMVLFPARANDGTAFLEHTEGSLVVEARDVGARPVRSFEWELPLPADGSAAVGWAGQMALVVALIAALLVVLSPCALELSLYYSAIISCTVTEGERAAWAVGSGTGVANGAATPESAARRRVLANLWSFVAGFTLLYAASGATLGLIGQGVRQPLGQYAGAFQVFGGMLIIYFALRVAGVDRWIGTLFGQSAHRGSARIHVPANAPGPARARLGRLIALPGRGLAALRERGRIRSRDGHAMRPRDSFLVGMGLSSACLTCMGGAVLYPLLVYAGITSWYSGLVTLTLYSLGIAVPMLLIALGFIRIRLDLGKRLGFHRALRAVSAVLLLGIGLAILFGYERWITDFTFGFLARVSEWTA